MQNYIRTAIVKIFKDASYCNNELNSWLNKLQQKPKKFLNSMTNPLSDEMMSRNLALSSEYKEYLLC